MAAASPCVISEFSPLLVCTWSVILVSWPRVLSRSEWALCISAAIARRLARISRRELAILPLSSFRLQSFSLLVFFLKLNFAVFSTISLIWVIGFVIKSPITAPITTEIPIAMSAPHRISSTICAAALRSSSSGAVNTYRILLRSVI